MTLTVSEQVVYSMLCSAAEAGAICPTNLDIEMEIGYESCSMGAWLVGKLERKGLIFVRRYQRFREIKIVATGKWTARGSSLKTDRLHVPRGAGSKTPRPTDRKHYKRPKRNA